MLECTPIDTGKMREEMEGAFERLIDHRQKVNIVIENVEKLLQLENALVSSDFLDLLNMVDEVLPKNLEGLSPPGFPFLNLKTIATEGAYSEE